MSAGARKRCLLINPQGGQRGGQLRRFDAQAQAPGGDGRKSQQPLVAHGGARGGRAPGAPGPLVLQLKLLDALAHGNVFLQQHVEGLGRGEGKIQRGGGIARGRRPVGGVVAAEQGARLAGGQVAGGGVA